MAVYGGRQPPLDLAGGGRSHRGRARKPADLRHRRMDGSMSPRYQFALKGRRHLPEPYHFTASGLPNVYLLSGVKIERDAGYGELVTIDHLPDLIMAIAFRLVSKPERLTGTEMRFLRKRMGVTQADLAKELWVNEQTVANYEKGKTEP